MIEFIADLMRRYRNVGIVAVIAFSGLLAGLFSIKEPMLGLLLILLAAGFLVFIYIFFKDHVLSFQRVLTPLLLVSILFPPIRLPAGIPDVRLELIVALVAWTLLFLGHLATGRTIRFRRNPMYKWFFIFGLAILLSTTYATVVKGYPLTGRDFWELGKLLKYLLIFALVANLRISPTNMKRYYMIALMVFLCSALFGFAQYLNLGNINTMVSPYYAPTQMRGLLVHRRITGTTSNPNEFGALMVLASSLALSGSLFFRHRKLRLFSWACLAVFSLAIVLTLSRSALIALAVAAGFILLFKYAPIAGARKSVQRLPLILLVITIIALIIVQLAPSKFFFRAGELGDIANATSWQGRVANWQDNFAPWNESPLLGWGPGKATMTTNVDNEWLLLLRRYGIIGILIFISWFASFYFGLARIRRSSPVVEIAALIVALQATLVAYAVYMIPAAIYHSLQLMPILLLFLGLAYSQLRANPQLKPKEPQP